MNFFVYLNRPIIRIAFLTLIAGCGDVPSAKLSDGEFQVALLANFEESQTLGFRPPQPNFIDADSSNHINKILNKMAAFKPSKIFVESIPGSFQCSQINKNFQAFVFNRQLIKQLPNDVTHQLGFRLAAKLGHRELYCADASRKVQEQQDQEALNLLNQEEFVHINGGLKYIERELETMLSNGDLAGAFSFLNDEDQLSELRSLRAALYQDQESPAARTWHNRNSVIVENMVHSTSELDDRILLIFDAMNLCDLKAEIEYSSPESKVLFYKEL